MLQSLRLLTFLAAFCLANSRTLFAQQPVQGTSISNTGNQRFALFQGTYYEGANGQTVSSQGVFKIDTATGDVWLFTLGIDKDGKFIERWAKIDNK
jgi:hypothetical protein